jgi:hypothetical protein
MSAVITNPPNPGTPQPQPSPPAQPSQQPPGAPGQPAPQPPPQNPADMGGMTPEQIRQLQVGVQPGTPQPAFQPPPVNPYAPVQQQDGQYAIALPTGQRYLGRSPEEAIQRLAEAQVNASQTISSVTQERDRFRQALTGDQPGQPQAKFDKAAYMELQQVDPILAANYLDQFRFGLNSPAEVPQTFQRMNANAMEYEMAREVNNFKAMAPDFPGSQFAVDAVMQTLRANNIPFKAENLRMIHNELATRGVYQRVPVNQGMQPGQAYGMPQTQPQPQIPGQPPAQLVIPNFEPQGNYGFGPNGFGSAPQPSMQPAQFQPQVGVPQYAPPQAGQYAAQQQPQQQPQVYYPPAPAAYPGMPPAAAAPMPPPPQGASPVPGAQQPNENQLNLMTAQALREVVEQRLQ